MEPVSVVIDGTKFEHWQSVTVTRSVDTFSTVTLTAPFDPSRKEFREVFRPFSFKPLKVLIKGKALFTGSLVGVHPRIDPNARTVEVTGYSLPGVLQDCTAPGKTVPHEFKKLGLRAIIEQLCQPFGLAVKIGPGSSEGSRFDKVKLEEGQVLFEFFTELAKQRNLVISDTAEGAVLCWRSVEAGNPVGIFVEGEAPLSTVSAEFNPQDYFSEITGFCSAKRGRKGSKHTEQNPWLTRLRPMSFKLDDTEKGDAPEATRAKLGRMFANVAAYTLSDLPTWRDPNGDLWEPNTTLKLTAPSVMIYRRTELLVRNVTLVQDADKETATLDLVLPGAFSGEPPGLTSFLPWEEPI